MLTIARLTFKEVLRKRIFLIVMLLTLAFLILYGLANHYAVAEVNRSGRSMFKLFIYPQILILGLYFSSFIVALLTVFSGVGAVSGDIESGVLHAIVPKPIKRSQLILGKYLGKGLIISIYAAGFLLAITGVDYYLTGYQAANILPALGLYILGPLVLLALSILGSTKLSTLANGVRLYY